MDDFLINIEFRGDVKTVNENFLEDIFLNSIKFYFNAPESLMVNNFEELKTTIVSKNYIDLAMCSDKVKLNDKFFLNVFFHFIRENDDIQFLIYFNIVDITVTNVKNEIENLRSWSIDFCKSNSFKFFKCFSDLYRIEDYYFDENGFGKLYLNIN